VIYHLRWYNVGNPSIGGGIKCKRVAKYSNFGRIEGYILETVQDRNHSTHTTTILQPFFRDHPGEPVPEENFWTLWCKGRLTEADTLTIRLGITPSSLTSAHLHHPPIFFTGRVPFLPPNQQCQSTESKIGSKLVLITNRKLYISFRLVPKSVTMTGVMALILRYFTQFSHTMSS